MSAVPGSSNWLYSVKINGSGRRFQARPHVIDHVPVGTIEELASATHDEGTVARRTAGVAKRSPESTLGSIPVDGTPERPAESERQCEVGTRLHVRIVGTQRAKTDRPVAVATSSGGQRSKR